MKFSWIESSAYIYAFMKYSLVCDFYMYGDTNVIPKILSVNVKIALTAIRFGEAANDK